MANKISFKDFQKLDIRIGTVVAAEVPKWSHWVMRLVVDFGGDPSTSSGRRVGKRTAFAGIMKFFKPEDLIGKQFPFIVNLEPKKVGPEKQLSECMMLMVTPKDDEETAPILFKIQQKVPNGVKVC